MAMEGKPARPDYAVEELKEALTKYSNPSSPAPPKLLTRPIRLYISKEDADLDIVCGGMVFKVHSLLFWTRCQFFYAACKSGFKVTALLLGEV